jgi:peptide/nickel transport system ATP-binding protein/oligopeptide transport system ATP-binding protein
MAVLRVEHLHTELRLNTGTLVAVGDLSLSVCSGETVALVGESGCGKTTAALSIMRLVASPPAYITGGRVYLDDEDILAASEARLRALRGERIAMVFQEPMTALDPLFTIGTQIVETVRAHRRCGKKEAREIALHSLERVHMPSPRTCLDMYPHQLSGGMRQRAMIAIALCLNPHVLIADEPTTALDVTVQMGILSLLAEMKANSGLAILLITHNLAVVSQVADRVCVMYAGDIVESAPTQELLTHPLHPYTQGLLRAIPRIDGDVEYLPVIRGSVPDLTRLPRGCRFAPRCDLAEPGCHEPQELVAATGDHYVRCWLRSS